MMVDQMVVELVAYGDSGDENVEKDGHNNDDFCVMIFHH